MGEYAEMMLDGTCCACCGAFLDLDAMVAGDFELAGYPVYCESCAPDFEDQQRDDVFPQKTDAGLKKSSGTTRMRCPECGKKCRGEQGLRDHLRAKHQEKPNA